MQPRASISAQVAALWSSSAPVATAATFTAGKDALRPLGTARNRRPDGAINQAVVAATSTPIGLAATGSGKKK